MADKLYLSWQDIDQHCQLISNKLNHRPADLIVAITKGGLIPAVIIANHYSPPPPIITLQLEETSTKKAGYQAKKVKLISPLNTCPIKNKHVLIIDDVSDTGSTLIKAKSLVKKHQPKTLTTIALHYKPRTQLKPDISAKKIPNHTWIIYPWEK